MQMMMSLYLQPIGPLLLSVPRTSLIHHSTVPCPPARCEGLESLLLAGNPQRQISAALLQRGTTATLSYLSKRLPPGHCPRVPKTPSPTPTPFAGGSLDSGHAFGDSAEGGGGATGSARGQGGSGSGDGTAGGLTGGGKGDRDHREALKKLATLKAEVSALSEEVGAPGMSQAKAYAVKKKLQMKRAAVIREERALKQAQQSGGT